LLPLRWVITSLFEGFPNAFQQAWYTAFRLSLRIDPTA
jgi:hypothetical protein